MAKGNDGMDWFKMQTVWGSSLERMSDTEAGRFIKAVYAFVRYGEEYTGTGKEEMLVWQAIDILRNDIAKFAEAKAAADDARKAKSEAMRQLAHRRWDMRKDATRMPDNAERMQNDAERMRDDAIRINGNADDAERMRSDAYKNKNKIKTIVTPYIPPEAASDSFMSDEEFLAIKKDHDEIFKAMEYAGFDLDGATMDKVVNLYALYGKDKVLSAIDACVENSVKKLVYLKGVLESREKEEKNKTEQSSPEKSEDKVVWLD